jgi:S-formylglutathione hydrolase FrmB
MLRAHMIGRRIVVSLLCALCVPVLATLTACGGSSPTTTLTCGLGGSGALTVAAPVTVTADGGEDLRGAAIAATAHTTLPTGDVSIACAPDIVPDGYVALGPAVTFGPDQTWSDRPFELTLPYKAARLPAGAENRHVRIVARRAHATASFFPPVANRTLDDADRYASRATFRASELTTYQVVALATAGTHETQRYAWNAIVGISMGGNAAMSIALRHPERFDNFADLGGEPGPSMTYSLAMVRDFLFGGFCTAADEAAGHGHVGELCLPQQRAADAAQFEARSDFEHMLYQAGDGVGLTLHRDLYIRASRDLARALSNPALYNPTNPYTPTGVDLAFIARPAADRCANPKLLAGFHDREFNPDGSKPVITFCDGVDATNLGLGIFDPTLSQTDPAELLLAVDLNGNGKRDAGEPVITNPHEPFSDVGVDGKADRDEPGYDPVTNPDPDGDDYHALRNPGGTEGNLQWDVGEPFEDVGLDGVAGTCQIGQSPPAGASDCFDLGEGDGKWTESPNVTRWRQSDLMTRLAALTDAQRHHAGMWFDAGIRDFLNASVSANAAVGQAMATYAAPFGIVDSFPTLTGDTSESAYDFTNIKWADLPRDGYVRYGDPDASPAAIMNGDGRHVGTGVQIIHRATTAFAWLDQRWPGGDRDDILASGQILDSQSYTSPTTGRVSPYGVFLPPGYDLPANAGRRYPVIYFLHGYGQEPKDLVNLSSVFANYMTAQLPLAQRFQKFIIVYVDGRCRPNVDGVPVDPTGDRCEGGTFYLDAPLGGPAQMETNMLELMDHIDASYRTKQPSDEDVVP